MLSGGHTFDKVWFQFHWIINLWGAVDFFKERFSRLDLLFRAGGGLLPLHSFHQHTASSDGSPAKEQGNQKEYQENDEQYLCNPCSRSRYSGKAENTGDYSNHEKSQSPSQHLNHLLR